MPRLLTHNLFHDAHLAARPMPENIAALILKAVVMSGDEGLLVTGLDHYSLACNDRFGELFGVSPEEVVSIEPEQLRRKVYPRIRDAVAWQAQLDAIYSVPQAMFEDELEMKGDPSQWLARWTGPVETQNGEVIARLWRFRDITSGRRREQMHQILAVVSACVETEPAAICKLIVQKLAAFYGATAILSIRQDERMIFREVSGMPLRFAFARTNKVKDSYCKVALRTCKPLLIQDGRLDEELAQTTPAKAGFTRYLGVPVCDRMGQPIGTLCVMDARSNVPLNSDDQQFLTMMGTRISSELDREQAYMERTAAQRRLASAQAAELESVSDQLSASQRQLAESEKLSTVGTLAATVAHDIRNIVSSLSIECSMGEADPFAALSNVQAQLDRFAVLAHRLLAYARPTQFAKTTVDTNEILKRVLALTASQCRVGGIAVVSNLSIAPAIVHADESQMEHMFVNLILNAVQAMHQGGELCIRSRVRSDLVDITVSDNGPGIDKEQLKRLFQPFSSSRPQGFGLGLYSCKRIADEHGWKIKVSSNARAGTTFTISMPQQVGGE